MRRKHGSNFNLVQFRKVVELYSCTGDKGYMMSDNLVVSDFVNENLSSDSSDSEGEKLEVKFLWWGNDDGASKVKFTPDVEDAPLAWQET